MVCCLLLALAEAGEAQIVRVGPGGGVSVAAPFVRVEVGPYGSTYVRAPFTSVYAPGYRGVVPRYGYQVAPSYPVRPSVPYPQLSREIPPRPIDAPNVGRTNESHWRERTRSARGRLGSEPAAPSQQRQQDLHSQWSSLHRDLGKFPSGASWQEYLEVPPEVIDGSEPKRFAEVLSRYDQVAGKFVFRSIARLASFQATHRLLAEREGGPKLPAPEPHPPLPEPEVIPLPQPLP
jgi:hypothetical protein